MTDLKIENADKLDPVAVEIAAAILRATIGPERCKCCGQRVPQKRVKDVISEWAGEFSGDTDKSISEIHGVIVNALIYQLIDRGVVRG